MSLKKKSVSSLIVSIFSSFAFSAEPVRSCNPSSYTELVKCAVNQSAEIEISKRQLNAASELKEVSQQWINPELDVESISKGSQKSELTAGVLFTVDLSGRRSALQGEAKAEYEKTKTLSDMNTAQLKLDLILKLYKISHLKSEIKIEEEAVSTFARIISQFQKRSGLSPEQEVSQSIFRMAMSDHELNLATLNAELEQLTQDVSTSTNLEVDQVVKNLPTRKSNWPKVDANSKSKDTPMVKIASSELKIAQSIKDRAYAEPWADLKIGPVVKQIKDENTSENFVGVGVTLPLPVFNWNGSGKKYGQQKVYEAELSLQLANKKAVLLRPQLTKKYENIVRVLSKTITSKTIEEKHSHSDRLFLRGLVPSSVVVEAHRQMIELEQKRNESEREAIETLGQIHILDNNFSEENL